MSRLDELKEDLQLIRIIISLLGISLIGDISKMFSIYEAGIINATFWFCFSAGMILVGVIILLISKAISISKEIGSL
jgi:hypothetical protein